MRHIFVGLSHMLLYLHKHVYHVLGLPETLRSHQQVSVIQVNSHSQSDSSDDSDDDSVEGEVTRTSETIQVVMGAEGGASNSAYTDDNSSDKEEVRVVVNSNLKANNELQEMNPDVNHVV